MRYSVIGSVGANLSVFRFLLFHYLPISLSRNRVSLYDRLFTSADRVQLGTGLVWQLAGHKCVDADVALVLERMPAVKVFGVVPGAGRESVNYPFRSLLYESSSYEHLKKVHFVDCVPATMGEAYRIGPVSNPMKNIMLWNCLLVQ